MKRRLLLKMKQPAFFFVTLSVTKGDQVYSPVSPNKKLTPLYFNHLSGINYRSDKSTLFS